jgi:acylphosphatase
MEVQAHIIVSGMVQGVGYRYFVMRLAKRMQLTGWARNLYSGEVEILVEGQRGSIESFIKDLWTGNPSALVRNVEVNWQKYTGSHTGFDITF